MTAPLEADQCSVGVLKYVCADTANANDKCRFLDRGKELALAKVGKKVPACGDLGLSRGQNGPRREKNLQYFEKKLKEW